MARKKRIPTSIVGEDVKNVTNGDSKEYCIKMSGGTKYVGPYGEVFIPGEDEMDNENEEDYSKEKDNDNVKESVRVEDVERESLWKSFRPEEDCDDKYEENVSLREKPEERKSQEKYSEEKEENNLNDDICVEENKNRGVINDQLEVNIKTEKIERTASSIGQKIKIKLLKNPNKGKSVENDEIQDNYIKKEKVPIETEYNNNKKKKKTFSRIYNLKNRLKNPTKVTITKITFNGKMDVRNEDINMDTIKTEEDVPIKMKTDIKTENNTASNFEEAKRNLKMINTVKTETVDFASNPNNVSFNPTLFSCNVCQQDYTTNSQLDAHLKTQSHLRIMRGGKRYTCDECTKGFSSKSNLKIHLKNHTGENSYKCDLCPKSFHHGTALMRHKNIHSGFKEFSCSQCSKMFYEKWNLISHMRTHTGQKPYKCDKCSKCFSQYKGWKGHLLIHAGLKPYTCSQCSYSVAEKGNLKKHMRKHTGEKPYTCDMCPQRFGYYESWKKHSASHGEGIHEKPFVCNQCSFSSRDDNSLKKHIKVHEV